MSKPFELAKMKVVFLVQLVCLIVFLPASHCKGFFFLWMPIYLIEQTCRRTTNYALCVSSLKSDPRSSKADVKGLALIMMDVAKAKATEILKKIDELRKKSQGDGALALNLCAHDYGGIIGTDIPNIKAAITRGDLESAEESFVYIGETIDDCEDGFQGCSWPTICDGMFFLDVCDVAKAIMEIKINF